MIHRGERRDLDMEKETEHRGREIPQGSLSLGKGHCTGQICPEGEGSRDNVALRESEDKLCYFCSTRMRKDVAGR